MNTTKLYKYLDINGGLMMLSHSNLQFTNATKLNDPFDCHPSLINFSHVSERLCKAWPSSIIESLEFDEYRRNREKTWICSLSKVYDSLLMWSYYNAHKGICIGIDMDKADKYLSRIYGPIMYGYTKLEVQYKDIIDKPDYFQDKKDFIRYQLCTKAKDWEHEQEVRLIILDPYPLYMALSPSQSKKGEPIDWKEVHAFPDIGGECFESIYLGVNINKEDKKAIIETSRKLNSNIKIYQMNIDPNAFRLNTELTK